MKCSKCKKGFGQKDMITNRLCKTCYLEVNAYEYITSDSVPSKTLRNCSVCGDEYEKSVVLDNGKCLLHYYHEEPEKCIKCKSCGKWVCNVGLFNHCGECFLKLNPVKPSKEKKCKTA